MEFGAGYSAVYDALYRAKNYGHECDIIEKILSVSGRDRTKSILDFGCGTGGHAIPLSKRGYSVLGVDRSRHMLEKAQSKSAALIKSNRPEFKVGDVRTFRLERKFDAAIMMFAVLGYQLSNKDVLAALRTVRSHLKYGGVFIFDTWFGPAVLTEGPSKRTASFETPAGRYIREAQGTIDIFRHVCIVKYRIKKIANRRAVFKFREEHKMRFFFPLEMELFFGVSGFSLIMLKAFGEANRPPSTGTWNVLWVAKAV